MKRTKCYLWRFTIVNRFTREQIDECFAFGSDMLAAVRRLRTYFPVQLYDVSAVTIVENHELVVVGLSNYSAL